jgi:hypothetical protein
MKCWPLANRQKKVFAQRGDSVLRQIGFCQILLMAGETCGRAA